MIFIQIFATNHYPLLNKYSHLIERHIHSYVPRFRDTFEKNLVCLLIILQKIN